MNTFKDVWVAASSYLKEGISVIAVRDKEQTYNGRVYAPKSAFKWQDYQRRIASEEELSYLLLEKYNTTGFGIVGGKVSGNLEIIDIDVKNWYGIDALLFQSIQTVYPQLWERLRIHKTPSGGYHIIYRIGDHEPEGNRKLCHKLGAHGAAIETRGEGGYVVASPAMGYEVFMNNPIPVITWAERCSIFAICEGFDEQLKMAAKQVESKKKIDTYYDENPFEHFNNSQQALDVLTNNGWRLLSQTNIFAYFERPGQQQRGRIGASFNFNKRIYYIFTSSTELEPSRGYNPSTVLSILQHGGDRKKTYEWLVENGFGKVKKNVEAKLVKSAVINNSNLPANLSNTAKQQYDELSEQLKSKFPYGVFWEENSDFDIVINRYKLEQVAVQFGYKLFKGDILVQVIDGIIHKPTTRQFYDTLRDYVQDEEANTYINIINAYETFIERHGNWLISRLPILDEEKIINDTREVAYKFYTNGVLQITSNEITLLPYTNIDKLIWAHDIRKRAFFTAENGRYSEFLTFATGYSEHVQKVIGYLSHGFKDETTPYIIVLTEECENPEDGGGAGKNVFCRLLEHTTTFTEKPGDQVSYDEKFLQSWNGERLFCISDAPKDFKFSFLKNLSSGDGLIKKLFKDERAVSNKEMPKFILQTNFSFEISDGGLKRRIIPVEFTDFFTKAGGIDVHFGCHFPKGWTDEDWNNYDTIIASSIQQWLKVDCKLFRPQLSEGGWVKQFKQTYGSVVYDLIEELMPKWCVMQNIINDDFKKQIEAFYGDNSIPLGYRPSIKKLHKGIEAYCAKNGIICYINVTMMSGTTKGKRFVKGDIPF